MQTNMTSELEANRNAVIQHVWNAKDATYKLYRQAVREYGIGSAEAENTLAQLLVWEDSITQLRQAWR